MRKTEPRRKVEKKSQPAKRHLAVRTNIVSGLTEEEKKALMDAGINNIAGTSGS